MRKGVICLILMASLVLCACEGRPPADLRGSSGLLVNAPFSGDAGWDWNAQQLEDKLGPCSNTYSSIYGGTTYSYPLTYLGHDGTVKYMFSDNGKLASVAWTFVTDSSEDIESVFTEAAKIETEKNGNCTLSEDSGNLSKVWYTDSKDIMVFTVQVGSSYGFQYSYIDRDFSKRDINQS